jgi:predicted N-formylglutamate amidohydrolase
VLAEAHRTAITVAGEMTNLDDRHSAELHPESSPASTDLLAAGDPAPVIVQNPGADSPYLLVCDHAGRAVPRALGDLGLPPAEFERHIAWDLGALALSRLLADKLGATLIAQPYSRLVIDCNRDPVRPDAFVTISDGTRVPANLELDARGRQARVRAIHAPYHQAISGELDARAARPEPAALILVHSFTPVMRGHARPWEVGVLHQGNALSLRALDWLRAESGLTVGDNEPYAMDAVDYTAPVHAQRRGLEYLELETRQDLLASAEGQARFAELYRRLLAAVEQR